MFSRRGSSVLSHSHLVTLSTKVTAVNMILLQISRIFGTWPFNKNQKVNKYLLVYSYGLFVSVMLILQQYINIFKTERDLLSWFRRMFEVSRTCIRCCLWLSHLLAVTRTVNKENFSLRGIRTWSKSLETVLVVTFTMGKYLYLE